MSHRAWILRALAWALASVLSINCNVLSAQSELTDSLPSPQYRMTEGKIPLLDFLRFIQLSTGKVVNYPAVDGGAEFEPSVLIEVLGDLEPLTYPIVRSILESNGYFIYEEQLADGRDSLRVGHRKTASFGGARATEILEPGTLVTEQEPDRLATQVFRLQHRETQDCIQALEKLLGLEANRRFAGPVTFVSVANTRTLIVKARRVTLNYVQRLLEFMDIRSQSQRPFVDFLAIEHRDVQVLADLIAPMLQATRFTAGAPTAGRPPARPASVGAPEVQLLADPSTQQLIVQARDETQLAIVQELVASLDVEAHQDHNIHVYSVRYGRAADLRDNLAAILGAASANASVPGRPASRRPAAASTAPALGGPVSERRLPVQVVAHEVTNQLVIQADPDEYRGILKVLEALDIRRRQVFLEVALVQVNEASTLNHALEYLVGNLDDDGRAAALAALGLSTVDPTTLPLQFSRVFTPGASASGVVAAFRQNSRLPVILRAIKTDNNAKILATPFILADDNETNEISIQTEVFFQTSTLRSIDGEVSEARTQESVPAGIRLSLLPTISQSVVLLDLNVESSSFGTASTADTLPDRNSSTISSRITIPNGELFIIGGLAREGESLAVSKIPLLGDIPLLGRLFQNRSTDRRRDNLYVFVSAHILKEGGLRDLSNQAQESLKAFGEDYRVGEFQSPTGRSLEEVTPNVSQDEQ